MSVLSILNYPNKKLRKIASNISLIDSEIKSLIKNMLETMYFNEGIGLAATQVDVHKRIIVIDISKNKNKPLILINPVFINKCGAQTFEEGCLSIPKKTAFVNRSKKVKIKAINCLGEEFLLKSKGLLATCIQHEMDHLIGKLFIDYIKPLKN
ncbi:def [Wigglesworthia glossinidia endosymbiont of Glossina brevipalpis]|uniref:Peptide deformylase n=1 Tax=Wigglesworthia glossinidia brevipalpis TaxID=36870 RepID=DEF_WIGBR|nr:RecName: Full=Peptide deformylase; Short=PDF; AltName: Full=Polypeptide deformylase [Wigglesworthia glossinidia endosymbiont of Glossina brevipalpis]BAC24642.1 def [Wigglesworthia glossinidia endosymbiont of Glossina brevipalpis]